MPPLLSIDEALARVLARVRPLESEPVPVAEAAGRVLAEDVVARIDLPPFPSSAMDGFAVRAEDVPGELPVVFRIAAGRPAERALEAGEAMEISTGGMVPVGADTVVPIEVVVQTDNSVNVRIRSPWERTSGRSEAMSAPAMLCSPRGPCSALLRSERSRQPGSPRSRAAADPGWSFSAPAPSSARRASRSARGRSTSRTARCSRRRSRPPGRWSTGSARSPTTRRSTAMRSSGGWRRTFS